MVYARVTVLLQAITPSGGSTLLLLLTLLLMLHPSLALPPLQSSAPGSSVVKGQNVLGGPLECCCTDPVTGYYRDGFCRTGGGDMGVHVVCAQVRVTGSMQEEEGYVVAREKCLGKIQ
jgi:hypothetical protein